MNFCGVFRGFDGDTNELVLFDGPGNEVAASKRLELDKDILKPRRSLQIAADLVDVRIYICTPQVLIEFVSNFDFNTMDQFIFDMLLNAELYQHKLFVSEIVTASYAAPIKCVHSYDSASRDV